MLIDLVPEQILAYLLTVLIQFQIEVNEFKLLLLVFEVNVALVQVQSTDRTFRVYLQPTEYAFSVEQVSIAIDRSMNEWYR